MDRRTFIYSIPALAYSAACSAPENNPFVNPDTYREPRIVDNSAQLSKDFPKIKRDRAPKHVILHCTTGREDDFEKSLAGLLSPGVNAHYLIRRNGDVHALVPEEYIAFHTGLSIWNGVTDLNYSSIGVEFVGVNFEPFTDEQYDAFAALYRGRNGMKSRYNIQDEDVLAHGFVAVCDSERTHERNNLTGKHEKPHRGRRSDPGFYFSRTKAGLYRAPRSDPDVEKRIVLPDERTAIEIDRSAKKLVLTEDGKTIREYKAYFGEHGSAAVPTGSFSIDRKDDSPSAGMFGSAYMRVNGEAGSFAIHGLPKGEASRYPFFDAIVSFFPQADMTPRGNVSVPDEDIVDLFGNVPTCMRVFVR